MGSNPIIHLIFWNNLVKKIKYKQKFLKKFFKKNLEIKKIFLLNQEKKIKVLTIENNLNNIKYKIKDKDLKNIDNWGVNNSNKKLLGLSFLNFYKNLNFLKNSSFYKNDSKIFKSYNNIIKKKINIKNKIKNKIKIFLYINFKSNKTKATLYTNKKCLLTISNGLLFKKLNLNNKKYIKSNKITFILLKNLNNILFKNNNNKYIYINIIGIKNKENIFINSILKNINNKNVVILKQPKQNNNCYFKVKKLKSIKRKLKKRIIQKIN